MLRGTPLFRGAQLMCHSRQPGWQQQTLTAINLLPEPSTQASQDITLGLTSLGPSPSQEMWVTQGWQSDQNAWWIGPNWPPITHEQGGKNCQGRSVRCGEGNFWHVINAKEPAIIQVLPREMGSYMCFCYDSASLPPLLTSGFTVLQKRLTDEFPHPQISCIYAPQKSRANMHSTYTRTLNRILAESS